MIDTQKLSSVFCPPHNATVAKSSHNVRSEVLITRHTYHLFKGKLQGSHSCRQRSQLRIDQSK